MFSIHTLESPKIQKSQSSMRRQMASTYTVTSPNLPYINSVCVQKGGKSVSDVVCGLGLAFASSRELGLRR